jgi:hypothetical protein
METELTQNTITTELNIKRPRGRPPKIKEPKPPKVKKTADMTTYIRNYMQNYKLDEVKLNAFMEYQKEYRQKHKPDPSKTKEYHLKYLNKKFEQRLKEMTSN